MIVPRTRLILISAGVLLPASFLAARYPSWSSGAVAAVVLLGAWALWDGITGRRRFSGVVIAAAPVARMTVDKSASLPLRILKPVETKLQIRLGLALPHALSSEAQDLNVPMAQGSERHLISWPCRAQRRGRYKISQCMAETPSTWGMWSVRRKFPVDCEVRVYPNLTGGRKDLQGLFSRWESGLRVLRKVGKGREFEQLREYLPGDNYEDIDWKATARRRHPVTRVFQVEQSQEVYVILDASRLSTRNIDVLRERRGQTRENDFRPHSTIFEHYIASALMMAVAAERAADRFGLLIFDAVPDCFIRAGRGNAHTNVCRDALYDRMPRNVSPDFDELFTFIGTHLRKRALLLFLTHLDDPLLAENFLNAMPVAARQHVLMVNMCRPPGAYPLFSSAEIRGKNGIYEHLVGHMLWNSISETRRKLRRLGAELLLLESARMNSQLIGQYLDIKQRQIL
jgi:uncharacterized protein (DUF58 family)